MNDVYYTVLFKEEGMNWLSTQNASTFMEAFTAKKHFKNNVISEMTDSILRSVKYAK